MGFKKRYLIVSIMLLMMLIGGVCAADTVSEDTISAGDDTNQTLTVDNHEESEDLAGGSDSDVKSEEIEVSSDDNEEILSANENEDVLGAPAERDLLGKAITTLNGDVQGGGTKLLTDDYVATANWGHVVTISSNTVIDGKGGAHDGRVLINGNGFRGTFYLISINNGYSATFQNINFLKINNDEHHEEGLIHAGSRTTVKFVNCTFQNCYHKSNGGIIYFDQNSNAEFENCQFIDCYDIDDGNYVNGGSLIYFANGAVTKFKDCKFLNTYVVKDPGNNPIFHGTIHYVGDLSNSEFKNCVFDNNQVTNYGGAIYFASTVGVSGEVNFINTTFNNNHADSNLGGAIYFNGNVKNLHFTSCNFTNHTTDGAIYFNGNVESSSFDNCTFDNNKAAVSGSIYVAGTTNSLDIKKTTFKSSTATGDNGGALSFKGTVNYINILNSNFKDNQATNFGGAIYFTTTSNNLNVRNSTFSNNKASNSGAGIYIKSGSPVSIDNCTFLNHDLSNGQGAAIYWGTTYKFATSHSTFKNNNALDGSTIYFAAVPTSIEITDSTFNKNTVTSSSGGALNVPSGTSSLTISGSTFEDNGASSTGMAIYIPGSSMPVTITDSSFINNDFTRGNGGAISTASTGKLTIDNTTFKDNDAQKGAAIFFARTPSSIEITDSTFTNNHVTNDNGGALNIPDGVSSTTINNCTFETNTASGNGGAIYVNSGSTSIDKSKFIDNAATGTANSIYVASGKTSNTISNSNFTGSNNIYIDTNSGVSLTKNNELSASAAQYMVSNKGTISLNKNKFNNVIINQGTITSQTYANVSYNKSYEYTGGYLFPVNATIVDDNNNSIISYEFRYTTNYNDRFDADETLLHNGTIITRYEEYHIGGTDTGLTNLFTYNATIFAYPAIGSYTWLQDKLDKFDGNVFVLSRNITFNSTYDLSPYNRYYGLINFTNGMLYQKEITFNGNGYTINGLNKARIFNITASNIAFTNTHFINASSKVNGGALYFNSGVHDVTIFKCVFENNKATGTGGAIYYNGNGEDISISDSSFNANSAYGGGAIQFNAGSREYNNIDIINCNFTNNKDLSNNNWGGSAIGVNNAVDVYVSNSKFESNVAKSNGAIIFDLCSQVVFNACNFTNNTASKSAGAIYFANPRSGSKTADITNCNFIKNTATVSAGAVYIEADNAEIFESNFIYNNAHDGSAIVFSGDSRIDTCYFENNTATGNGTIYVKDGIDVRADMYACTFVTNNAYSGGAIYYNTESYPDLFIGNCTFIKNIASHNGGAILYEFLDDIYRDYNNFDGRGTINQFSNRTTVAFISSTGTNYGDLVARSLFADNFDYKFNVTTESVNRTGIVKVQVEPNANSQFTVVNVTVTARNGTTYTTIINNQNFNTYFNRDLGIFEIQYNNLEEDENFTVEVSFHDNVYYYKNGTAILVTGHGRMGQFAYLQFLIDKAIRNNEKELNLTRSFIFDEELDVGQMHINETITINLFGYSINALGYSRIFNITADNVVLKNIRFLNGDVDGRNGSSDKNGGAIFWCGENGTVENSYFIDNRAEYGGAIYFNSTASDCKVSHCTFTNNNATYDGGAIDCNASSMNLTNTIFEGNVADFGAALCRDIGATGGFGEYNQFIRNYAREGGAALGWMGAQNININHYTFIENIAEHHGGAIYVKEGSDNCIINNSYFRGNNVTNPDGHGGAIDSNAKNTNVLNTTFLDNHANYGGAIFIGIDSANAHILGSKFNNNGAKYDGGAININASSVMVNESSFNANTAKNGGAIYVGGNGTTNYIYNSTFTGNNATGGRGGAIDWVASAGHIINSNFTSNNADYGGGVYMGGDSKNSLIKSAQFMYNTAVYNGGAIDWNATEGTLVDTEFWYNEADYGAALCREVGAVGGSGTGNGFIGNHARIAGAALGWMGSSKISIDTYFFYLNTADKKGGAIYVASGSENCLINNSVFIENSITDGLIGYGGAIYSEAGNMTVLNSTFTSNKAYDGGAILIGSESGHATIRNATFATNEAENNGGAINLIASNVNITTTHFNNNIAKKGGAVYVGGNAITNYITLSTFTNNRANGGRGGAVDWVASAGHITETNFTTNYADYGGALYMGGDSNNSVISHVIFDDNTALYNGGAIDWNATRGNLTHTIFKNNKANYGAALCRESGATFGFGYNNTFESNHAYVSGAALAWLGSSGININKYTFIDNTADLSGGAIYIASDSPNCVINNSYFKNNHITNTTGGHGGAIDCMADNMNVLNTTFDENHAYYGGAMYIGSSSGNSNITNVTFNDNYATQDGGAIYITASSVSLNDTHFNRNRANNGGAIYVGGNGLTSNIYYSTFNENRANGGYGGAIDWVASTGNIYYSNFTENVANYGGAVYIGGNSNNSVITHVIFDTNTANFNGGAIDWNASAGNLTHTKFIRNVAEYGAALCREGSATGGFGYNNTFIANHARKSGAALAWLGAEGIKIDTYFFYNNTAEVSGGAIYVGKGSDRCKILNSEFNGSSVSSGRGGDIDWIGSEGYVYNTTFSNSIAALGGSIYIDELSDNTQLVNTSFTSVFSIGEGGAIIWYGDDGKVLNSTFKSVTAREYGAAISGQGNNMVIDNSVFQYASISGFYDEEGASHGSGAAINWINSDNLQISNTKIADAQAHANGGAISAVNCNNSKLYNVTFKGLIALNMGGAIFWANSNNLTIELCNFTDVAGAFNGGALYIENVDTLIKDSLFNHTQSPWGLGGAIYTNADLTVLNSTFVRYESLNDTAAALYLKNGNATVNESRFDGINAILITKDAEAHLTKNNITNSKSGLYSVYNEGDLYLEKNVFDHVIVNDGMIWTETHIYMLDNQTIDNATFGENFTFWATIKDDNNNSIISVDTLNGTNNATSGVDSYYMMHYNKVTAPLVLQGVYRITGNDTGLYNPIVHPGIIKIRAPTDIKFNITGSQCGEKIIIKAIVYPETSQYNITGNVTFKVGDNEYSRKIIEGIATLELANLTANTYDLTAIYEGDDCYYNSTNSTYFIVKLRESWINVVVANTILGNSTVAIATTNANGTVTFIFKGKKYNVTIENGVARLLLNATDLTEAGNHSIDAYYAGNEYFDNSINTTTFDVAKLNTTVNGSTSPINVGDVARINITGPDDINATVKVTVDGVDYFVNLTDGRGFVDVANLANRTYTVNIVYLENDRYNMAENITTLVVSKLNTTVAIEVENITYGEVAHIIFNVENVTFGNLTVKINNGEERVVYIANGKGYLDLAGLAADNYTIDAVFNSNYKFNTTSAAKVFNVAKAEPKISVVVNEIEAENNATITVYINNTATGKIFVKVNGKEYNATIENGVAKIITDKFLNPGDFQVNVTYKGDNNYTNATNNTAIQKVVEDTAYDMNISIVNENIIVESNVTIQVYVPLDATGNVTVYIGNTPYNATISQGIATLSVNITSEGLYLVNATYNNTKYAEKTVYAAFRAYKTYIPITIDVNNTVVGNKTKVIVTLPADADFNATIEIDGVQYTPVSVNGNEAVFELPSLIAGNKTVTAIYAGDNKYLYNATTEEFIVSKVNSTVSVATSPINVSDVAKINVTGPSDFNGTAIVNINGTNYTVILTQGRGSIEIVKLGNGTYNVTVTYLENDKYLSNTNKTQLVVSKITPVINATLTNITLGEAVTINVVLPDDVTGTVKVTIANITKIVAVNGKNNTVIILGVPVGEHNVTITYNGNYKYLSANTTGKIKVDPALPTDGFIVEDLGNRTVIVYVPANATGNITIKIGNHTYNATIENSTAVLHLLNETPGVYANTTVIYSGDSNNAAMNLTKVVKIPKYATPITIEVNNTVVGNITRIIVHINENVTENVTIEIDGEKYSQNVTDGEAVFEIEGLIAGAKTVTATYDGDDWFVFNSTTQQFNVSKLESYINVTVENISVDGIVIINITAPNYNGLASVYINATRYTVIITNGVGQLKVLFKNNGTYTINATYIENNKYYSSFNDTESFTVSKIQSEMEVTYNNITVGDNAVFEITLHDDAYGNVTISIGNITNVTVAVMSGVNKIIIPNIPTGNYTVNITYNGNYKYLTNFTSVKLEVGKVDTLKNNFIVEDLENGTVIVHALGNATGNITIKIGEGKYNGTIIEGKAIIQLTGVIPNVYNATVIYSGDENFTNTSFNATIRINKKLTPIAINVGDVNVSDVAVIIVTVPVGVSDNVTIEIDGVKYNQTVNATGSAVFRISGLTAGNKTVTAIYAGDDWYAFNATTGQFKVTKVKSSVNVTTKDIESGQVARINITGPRDFNGTAVVTVDGVKYIVTLTNGVGFIDIAKLTNDTYRIYVTYNENAKYLSSENNSAVLNVKKTDSYVRVTPSHIVVGDNEVIIFELPGDATGNITVKVNNYVYTAYVSNGKANLTVPHLHAGRYVINATYNGNDKYGVYVNDTEFFYVVKHNVEIELFDEGNRTIVIALHENATGNITVLFGHELYYATLKEGDNGITTVTLINATPGRYTVYVNFTGDADWNDTEGVLNITVPKYNTPIVINDTNIEVADKETIIVTLPENATGNVTIEIDGKTYEYVSVDKGVYRFEIYDLTAGNKTVVVRYYGDKNYTANITYDKFTVTKHNSTVNVTSAVVAVDSPAVINITGPKGYNGDANVTVNNVTYYVVLNNGSGQLAINGLGNGTYHVKVTYLENDKYLASHNGTATITVYKLNTTVTIFVDDIDYGRAANITVNVTGVDFGYITVKVNNTEKVLTIANGTANWILTGLAADNYTVTANFGGNYKYNVTSATWNFKVRQVTPSIEVLIGDVEADQNATITVYIDAAATGKIYVLVNGSWYNKTIDNGKVEITTKGLPVGDYPVHVVYLGDKNFTYADNNASSIHVTEGIDYRLNITVYDVIVENNVTIMVWVPSDAEGNVTIYVGDERHTAEIIGDVATLSLNITSEGLYKVNATYNSTKYASKTVYAAFRAFKTYIPITIDVNDSVVGNKTRVIVILPGDADFNATIEIDGKQYTPISTTGGVAVYELPSLVAGDKTVTAIYNGDNKYVYNSTTKKFTVDKIASQINVTVEGIEVDGVAVINVTGPSDINGTVIVVVDGVNYTVILTQGKGSVSIAKLAYGPYTVNATYIENDKYLASFNDTEEFTVSKVNSTLDVEFANITVGDNLVLNITVPADAYGNVTIKISNMTPVTVAVYGGLNTIVIPGLPVGVQDVNVTYNGNYRYLANESSKQVNVSAIKTTENDIIIEDYRNGTVKITVLGNGTGNVTVKHKGENYTVTLENSTATLDLRVFNNTHPGMNNFTIFYSGDVNHNSLEYNTTLYVAKWASDVNVTATPSIMVGGIVEINVNVTTNASGIVLVDINGTHYYVNLTDSQGILKVRGLSEGSYVVKVRYTGDENFTESVDETTFTVTPGITVVITGSGNNTVATVTVPGNVEGNLTVLINNETYRVVEVHGQPVAIPINNLTPGEYNLTAVFTDVDGVNTTAFKYLVIGLYDTPISIDVNDSLVGDTVKVVVTVPVNATQNVTIAVGGQTITNTTHNGVAVFYITGLTDGPKTITATYAGNATYAFNSTTERFTVSKRSSQINVTVTDIEVGSVARINVIGPADVNGTVIVTVDGVNYTVTLTDGEGFVEIAKLGNGTYNITAVYVENDKYNSTVNDTASFIVSKVNSTLNVEFNNITVGDNLELNITVPADAYGNVTIKIGNLTPITVAVYGGLNTIYVPEIAVGQYNVTVTYNGNYRYLTNASGIMKLKVSPVTTTVKDIIIEDYRNGTVKITVLGNATGNVTVKHKTEQYTVELDNGTAVLDLRVFNNTRPGVNNFTIIYSGDDNHNGVEYNTTLYVPKYESDINITTVNIMVGGTEVITINVTSGATGLVLLNISGTGYYVNLTGNTGIFRLTGLAEGHYDVKATYLGDENYTASYDAGSFDVTEGITLTISGSGNNTIVTVTVPNNVTGNLTAYIDGRIYNITEVHNGQAIIRINNLTTGDYNLTAVFTDQNGTNTTAYKLITIGAYDTPITIVVGSVQYVGESFTVTVKVPAGAKEFVTIFVDGHEYSNKSDANGYATFTVGGLTDGQKTITATYAGDVTYAFNSTTDKFTVYKHGSYVNVNVSDINVDDTAVINITAPSYYNGHVIVNINGTEYNVNITYGRGQLNVTGLTNGTYYINATYVENDKYYTSYNDTVNFTVSKLNATMDVEFANITVGDNVKFIITIPSDAYGNVTINIGTLTPVTVAVMAGENIIYVPDVPVGEYNVTVTYNGNYKYLTNTSGKMKLKVSQLNTTEEDITIEDSGNGTVIIKVSDNATGNVTITINNNETIVLNLTNGSAVVNLSEFNNTVPGVNNITIIYSGDENHTGITVNSTVTVPKWASSINATGINIRQGDIEYISVEITPGATGLVVIEINGTGYYVNLTTNTGKITIPALSEDNYEDIKVTYLGNENYTESSTTVTFNVTAPIKIVIEPTGNSTNITIVIPGNETGGNVTVIIDNNQTIGPVNVTDGNATVDLGNLTPGEHNITVIYVDGNNVTTVVNQTITVPKWTSEVNATAVNIREGDIEYIKVEITPGATGLVTIEIDGKGYFVNLTDSNKGVIIVSGLSVGNYTNVAVSYVGNDYYKGSSTNVTFKVTPAIKIVIDPTGNSTNITIVIPGNETGGNVTVIVDNNQTIGPVNVTNGTATVDLGNLTPGEHNITVIYVDGNGTESRVNQTITVPKWTSEVNATGHTIREGDIEYIDVEITPGATGLVTIEIDGKGYFVNLTDSNKGKIAIPALKEGDYTNIAVNYIGNEYYEGSSTNVTFKVTAPIKIEIDPTGNSTNITIVIPGNETGGNVTVIIDNNQTIGPVNVTDGNATIDLGNLTPGEHNITIIYIDGNGTKTEVNQTITVPKWDAKVNATAVNIREGDDETITIVVTPNAATGRVLVDIDGKGYYANLTKGEAKVIVSGLKKNNYIAYVTYLGDDKYNNATTNVSFTVSEAIKIEINPNGNSTNITIVVPGNESAGNVTVIVDNQTIGTVNVTNGTATVDLGNLTPGEHNITVIYVDGNGTESVVNQTITVPKWTSEVNATGHTIREGDIEYIDVEITPGATGLVTIEIDGKGYFVNLTDSNKGKIAIPALKEGDYTNIAVNYIGNEYYEGSSTTVTFKVTAPIKIEIDPTGNSTNITIVIPGNETGGNVTVIIDNNQTVGPVNVTDGNATIDLGNLTPGEHNITIIYIDGNGTKTEVNQTITVPKWDATVDASGVNIREGDDETITIIVTPSQATGRVLVDIAGKGYYANLTGGEAKVIVSGLKEGEYTAYVTYLGDDKYNNATTTASFKVSEAIKIVIDPTGNSTNITVVVPGNETGGNVTVIVDNKTIGTANVTNGTGTVDLGNLTPGEHNVTVIYVDGNGTESRVNQTITVPKWDSKVSATSINITQGEDEKITITVTPDKTSGIVLVDIAGKGYYGNVTNGKATVIVSGLKAGQYHAVVTYLGDDRYNNSTTTTDFKVLIDPDSSVEVTANETDVKVNVTLPEDATGNITVIVDNQTKVVPVTGGENVITISNVSSGTHDINVTYSGDENYDSFSTVKTVYVGSTINAKDKLVRGYNSEFDYEAEFLDNDGHVLVNRDVQFVVDGTTYTVKTDEKGVARLHATLAVGTYNVTCINPVTGQQVTKQAVIVKRIVENKDLTMDFDDGSYFTVRAIDDDGTPVGAGEVVSLKVNGISYVGVTDDNGYAKVKINLNPKTYTITIQYRGYKTTSKLVVKQTLKLVKKTVTVKKGKKLVLKAQVKLSNGKAVKGKVIKFKFYGKTYKAKTNKKGIAKVTIKPKVTKKLKKGKKITYYVKYLKNTVKGKVKVKK
ncbi:Ig-like domain repeat protein [Methanobrevibacter sp.]